MFHNSLETLLDRKDVVIISKYSNTIEYKLKTTLDSSGLTKLQSEIKKVQTELRNLTTYSTSVQLNKPVKEAIKDLDKLPEALKKTTKKRLRTLNIAQVAGYLTASLVLGLGIPNLNIYITNTLDKKRKAEQAKLAEQKISA